MFILLIFLRGVHLVNRSIINMNIKLVRNTYILLTFVLKSRTRRLENPGSVASNL